MPADQRKDEKPKGKWVKPELIRLEDPDADGKSILSFEVGVKPAFGPS